VTEPTTSDQVVDSSAVENLVQVLVKGLRAIQLYLPNNPIYQKAVDNVRAAFVPVWEDMPELYLQVTESELLWEDIPVYSQPSKAESVAWFLFKDGVRSFTLARGIEDEEIVAFLEVIKKAQSLPKDATDDLLTLLWEQDFQYVLYTAVELGAEGVTPLEPAKDGWVAGSAPEAEEVRRRVQEDVAAEEETPSAIVRIDDFDGAEIPKRRDRARILAGSAAQRTLDVARPPGTPDVHCGTRRADIDPRALHSIPARCQ
jgi:hypothetical protein